MTDASAQLYATRVALGCRGVEPWVEHVRAIVEPLRDAPQTEGLKAALRSLTSDQREAIRHSYYALGVRAEPRGNEVVTDEGCKCRPCARERQRAKEAATGDQARREGRGARDA